MRPNRALTKRSYIILMLACFWLIGSTAVGHASCIGDESSLRSAIANASPGATINVCAGTITLTGGELGVGTDLTITGQGAGVTIIDGNNGSRVFFVNPGTPGATTPPTTTLLVQI